MTASENIQTRQRVFEILQDCPKASIWLYRPEEYQTFEEALKKGAAYRVEHPVGSENQALQFIDCIQTAVRCIGGTALRVHVAFDLDFEVYPLGKEPT